MESLASSLSPTAVAAYLGAINFAAMAAFGIDKRLAASGARRLSEAGLLRLALAGGTLGAYAGRRLFRHKTSKQPFSGRLHAIAALQLAALALAMGWVAFG